VTVRRTHLVGASVVVEGELELLVLPEHAEEIVGRLEFALADDRQVAAELRPSAS
jgi:hypothetical protein